MTFGISRMIGETACSERTEVMAYFTLKDGGQLYYEDTGRGNQTILMLHGWISTHKVFSRSIPAISKAARCITYDHRGHGKSMGAAGESVTMDTLARDLNELITGLDLHDLTLLGWSMGAGVILNYVSLYGCSALRQIVLCDMSPRQMNDADWVLGLFQGKLTKESAENKAEKDFYELYRTFAVGAVPKLSRIPEHLLRVILRKKLGQCDENAALSLAQSMLEADYRDVVGKIDVPVHYFYATPGSLFSPELADWYRDHIHAPFSSTGFPNSSHMLISEHPIQFAKAVLRALRD